MSVKILGTGSFLPEKSVSNDDLSKVMDTSDEWISSRTGIRSRHISIEDTTSTMAVKAAEKALEVAGISAEELDHIFVATLSGDYATPSTACQVQKGIGAVNAVCMDINAACSGFVFGLNTAVAYARAGMGKKMMIIGVETLSKILDWSDRSTCVLFGDGAGGVLLESSEQQTFLAESLYTDGSRGEVLQSSFVGLSSPYSNKEVDHKYLSMDGRAVFDFAIRDVAKSIQSLLATAPVAVDEIDYFFLHQANDRILDKIAKKIGVPREKLPANMMEYGNTSAASIPILLSECVDQGLIKLDGSQTILLSGFGGGLTWGTLLVTI